MKLKKILAAVAAAAVAAAAVAVSSCSLCAPGLAGAGPRFLPVGLHGRVYGAGVRGSWIRGGGLHGLLPAVATRPQALIHILLCPRYCSL